MEGETFADLKFPFAGIDHSQGLMRQPTRRREDQSQVWTTVTGTNVRAHEPATSRERGGARSGLTKWVSGAVVASWIIQELNTVRLSGGGDLSGGGRVSNSSGRAIQCIAVSQGNVYAAQSGDVTWSSPTNLTGDTPPLNSTGVLFSAENNQKLFFFDGVNDVYYDPRLNTINTWTLTAGDMPADSENNRCRLGCTWRGRTVGSGLLLDPQNIFFSRVNDPFDFDYGADVDDPLRAVALNLAPMGLIGDMVTGLCPYNDDTLVVFCDHSIFIIRGDPTANGQVDRVSDAIGGTWGICWCKGPDGTVYFFSNMCDVYSLDPTSGAKPVPLSLPIRQLLEDTDTGNNAIRLIWDDRYRGLHLFITPLRAPASAVHFFWEQRTGAWWKDTFANNNHNPLCCATFDGNEADDRVNLIGSWDGYVRVLDIDATDDDGTAIQSQVILGPILTRELDDVLCKDLQAVLAEDSGDVTYSVLTGRTPQLALDDANPVTGTWSESRNGLTPVRRAGYAVYVKISATVAWALESVRVRFAGRNKVRRRGK